MNNELFEKLKENGIIKSMCQNLGCNDNPETCTCNDRDWEINWSKIKPEPIPRVLSVCYDTTNDQGYIDLGNRYIFLGEITNMPCHGVFIDCVTNQIIHGLHIDDFKEVPEDEV